MSGNTTWFGVQYPSSSDYVKDGATAIQTVATGFDSAVAIPTYNAQTGTTYTFVLADTSKTVTASNAAASIYTIPPQASVAWTASTTLNVTNLGAGVVTFAGGAGVTVTNTAQTLAQYQSAQLIRTGTNAWTVVPASGGASASGLTLINATTFSAVASQSFNDVFSATYDNYVLMMDLSNTANEVLGLRYRVGGSDNTNATYAYHIQSSNTGATTYSAANANTSTGNFISSSEGTNTEKAINVTVFAPFLTERTHMNGYHNFSSSSGAAPYYGGILQSAFTATTSFTGFTVYVATGTMSGRIRVYGVQN
jgi:hypothetical protein